MNYSIVLPTCDHNSWCVAPFLRLHEKFWGEDITIVAPHNYTNHKHFQRVPSNWNSRIYFSYQIQDAIAGAKHDNVIVMLADYFLYQQVDTARLSAISDYMTQNQDVVRVDVGGQGCNSPVSEVVPGVFSGEKFLQMSLTPGMWNRKLWSGLLESKFGLDPWSTETESQKKFVASSLRSLLARPQPVFYTNTLRGRDDKEMVTRRDTYPLIKDLVPARFKVTYEN